MMITQPHHDPRHRITLGLAMIVRDEEATITRCLRSLRDQIDHWTIIDTGSTDNTKTIIRDALDGIPGELHDRKWQDFGTNRSEALALAASTADYLLMPDADMELDGTVGDLTADVYLVPVTTPGFSYSVPRLARSSFTNYRGVTHEFLDVTGAETIEEHRSCRLLDHADGGNRAGKFERDLELLSAAVVNDPTDARSVFYLARTLDDMDRNVEAIDMYKTRSEMQGWDEETFYARYRLGCLLINEVSFAGGARELISAWESRPHRAEPLRALAYAANHIADRQPIPDDVLFVHTDQYVR